MLSLPTPEQFQQFVNNPTDEDFIVWASDLFILATGIDDDPLDPMEERIIQRAILQMAWYLSEDHENRESMMNMFTSERIGSYSYSKMLRGNDDLKDKIPAFLFAVDYFTKGAEAEAFTVVSEHVFTQPYRTSKFAPNGNDDYPPYEYSFESIY